MHPEIARRAILAGTSEKGVCPECGAPWKRVVERGEAITAGHGTSHKRADTPGASTSASSVFRTNTKASLATVGWTPTCKCGRTDTVPAMVLDPFDYGTYRGDEQVKDYRILQGDVRERLAELPDESVHCVVTSPPYWNLRDYRTALWEGGDTDCDHTEPGTNRGRRDELPAPPAGWAERAQGQPYKDICGKCGARRVDRQLGLEPTPGEFVQHMVEIFRDVRRVLRRDGVCFINLGDSYANAGQTGNDRRGTLHDGGKPRYTPIAGLKPKDLVGMPWMVAFALRADGWYLRSAITWCKRAPMPESVTDRPTSATEMIFLLAKSEKYYYDADAVREQVQPDNTPIGRENAAGIGSARHAQRQEAGKLAGGKSYGVAYCNPLGRNLWNYWLLGPEPFPSAHFATFPTAIPERCIRAGTSERGVCPECGAPWKRVVERAPAEHPASYNGSTFTNGKTAVPHANVGQGPRYERTGATTWQPTCKCGRTDTVPATVLDPFSGAGTTCLVALRLGRRAVGIELNGEYIAMSHKRIQSDPAAMNLNMELVEMEESA